MGKSKVTPQEKKIRDYVHQKKKAFGVGRTLRKILARQKPRANRVHRRKSKSHLKVCSDSGQWRDEEHWDHIVDDLNNENVTLRATNCSTWHSPYRRNFSTSLSRALEVSTVCFDDHDYWDRDGPRRLQIDAYKRLRRSRRYFMLPFDWPLENISSLTDEREAPKSGTSVYASKEMQGMLRKLVCSGRHDPLEYADRFLAPGFRFPLIQSTYDLAPVLEAYKNYRLYSYAYFRPDYAYGSFDTVLQHYAPGLKRSGWEPVKLAKRIWSQYIYQRMDIRTCIAIIISLLRQLKKMDGPPYAITDRMIAEAVSRGLELNDA